MKKYNKPETETVELNMLGCLMQGIIDTGGTQAKVDPDNPVDPNDPNAGLSNVNPIWDDGPSGGQ